MERYQSNLLYSSSDSYTYLLTLYGETVENIIYTSFMPLTRTALFELLLNEIQIYAEMVECAQSLLQQEPHAKADIFPHIRFLVECDTKFKRCLGEHYLELYTLND